MAPFASNGKGQPGQTGASLRMSHQKLKRYETQRRLAYSSKLDTSMLYWKSYCDLWSAGLQETARAHRLVLGMSRAQQNLADAMMAMYEDVFLDDKGNALLKPKQRKRLAHTRSTPNQKRINADDAFAARASVLTSVRESQKIMSEQLSETANNIEGEISNEIDQLFQSLTGEFDEMEQLGNAIIAEMERAEQDVVRSWDTYNTHALDTIGEQGIAFGANLGRDRVAPAKPQEKSDTWLLEMQYRVVTSYQNTVWEKGNAEMSRLFSRMKSEECRRRTNLREYLVAFVQRQQRVCLSMPNVQNPILEEISGMSINPDEIDGAVRSAITERAEKLRAMSKPMEPDIEFDDEINPLLESPLTSEMMSGVSILEYLRKDTTNVWDICLAVITADAYLHLFDVSAEGVKLDSSPVDVFQTLSPADALIESNEAMKSNSAPSNTQKSWIESLVPVDSIILGNCSVRRNGNVVELTETMVANSASKMFGVNNRTKKQSLRTSNDDEMDEWIELLKNVHM